MLPEIRGVLEAQMTRLEEDKPKLNIVSKREDGQECEAFAVTVFNRADKQDRSGKANLNTVKAFYVASVFIDVSPLAPSNRIFHSLNTPKALHMAAVASSSPDFSCPPPLPFSYKTNLNKTLNREGWGRPQPLDQRHRFSQGCTGLVMQRGFS